MSARAKLVMADMILLALRFAGRPLTKSDVIVLAFRMFPRVFSFSHGKRRYPHSNSVIPKLYGLVSRKLAQQTGESFQITDAGIHRAGAMANTLMKVEGNIFWFDTATADKDEK
jgi:hypothetical protein